MRFLLLLIIIAGVAGYFTRPNADAHWKTVAALIRDGDIDGGELSKRSAKFTDYYVTTKYLFSVEAQARAECWGAFTRFLCLKPGGTTKVDMPAVSAGAPPS
ncbi:MAG TPA: hypothetical protein VGO52_13435 [Hyphomonadaceae bacterium]|nr:hypothetical protein [Hyphomonadaceae bacterium]